MILHMPHSSRTIPGPCMDQFVLPPSELERELTLMTDAYTDELFGCTGATAVRSPVSRLAVDVERFPNDDDEPMSKVGMGMIYTQTAHGKKLRRPLGADERKSPATTYYESHHKALLAAVEDELAHNRTTVVVDCRSFPSRPLPCDQDQSLPRPHFCVGTDSFHTPQELLHIAEHSLKDMGYDVGINRPYAGALVPLDFYAKDRRVLAVMIEINRSLYMDESTGMKSAAFETVKTQVGAVLEPISRYMPQSRLGERPAQPRVATAAFDNNPQQR